MASALAIAWRRSSRGNWSGPLLVPRCDSATAYGSISGLQCPDQVNTGAATLQGAAGTILVPMNERQTRRIIEGRLKAGPGRTRQTARGDVHARGRGAGADGRTRRGARRPGGTTGQDGIRRHRARPRRSGVGCRGAVPHQRSPLALGLAVRLRYSPVGEVRDDVLFAPETPRARSEHSTPAVACASRPRTMVPSGAVHSRSWTGLERPSQDSTGDTAPVRRAGPLSASQHAAECCYRLNARRATTQPDCCLCLRSGSAATGVRLLGALARALRRNTRRRRRGATP